MNAHRYSRRELLKTGSAATGLLAFGMGLPAVAQASIEQLNVLCTGPAGSIPDIVARRVAEQMAGRHAQRAVVENRPGAAGQIAVNALKSSRADGSTLLLAQGAIATVYPYLYVKLAYDPQADLKPVSLAGEMTLGLAVGPAVPPAVSNLQELLAWMRRNPSLANVGSPGTGTLPHLLEAMLFRAALVDWMVAASSTPAALASRIAAEQQRDWEPVIRNANIRAE